MTPSANKDIHRIGRKDACLPVISALMNFYSLLPVPILIFSGKPIKTLNMIKVINIKLYISAIASVNISLSKICDIQLIPMKIVI